MIRFLCLNAFIALHSILFCAWGFLLSLLDKRGERIHRLVAVPWAKVILWVCGVRVAVSGLENLDGSTPCIYMTNHQSYFDIFALLAYLRVDFKFIMKEELMRVPLLGMAMRRAGYIGIEREDPKKAVKSMRQAAERIQEGFSLVIFPEGTRSTDGRLQPFKRGGFHLAFKCGCDIVPVTISNSRLIVPKGSLRINKGSFAMNIGKPISVKPYGRKDVGVLMALVRDGMERYLE